MEVGCGESEHSLRVDAELAIASHRKAKKGHIATLVRIDPSLPAVPPGAGLGLALGAKDCLLAIHDKMGSKLDSSRIG